MKIYNQCTYTIIIIKKFFSLIYKNEQKNINFEDKKIKKSDFYKKTRKYLI